MQLGCGLKDLVMHKYDSKMLSLEEAKAISRDFDKRGLKVVLVHGVFDLLHPGHLEHFSQAANLGDVLIVSVTADRFVNKGPGRPVFNLDVRMKALTHIASVDFVIPSHFPSGEQTIRSIKPHFYVKGREYEEESNDITGKILLERQAVEECGGEIRFTDGYVSSSTHIINRHLSPLSNAAQEWIAEFHKDHSTHEVLEFIDRLELLKVAVVGETIIDCYTDCSPLGKSGKHPTLVFQKHESECLPGGVLAIGLICQEFSNDIEIYTHQNPSFQTYTQDLPDFMTKMKFFPFVSNTKPNILKHRFVEKSSGVRIFEYYDFAPEFFSEIEIQGYWKQMEQQLSSREVVIVADYGHGFLSKEGTTMLEGKSSFLAVNTQINAGNRGFNTITKYKRADLICLNGGELQLELRDSAPDYKLIVPRMMKKMNSRHAVLTLGADGLMVFDSKGQSSQVPAMSSNVIDKVGAGDSVLAVSSLLSFLNAPIKIIGLISNVVAAHEVKQRGHKNSLSSVDLKKNVRGILG